MRGRFCADCWDAWGVRDIGFVIPLHEWRGQLAEGLIPQESEVCLGEDILAKWWKFIEMKGQDHSMWKKKLWKRKKTNRWTWKCYGKQSPWECKESEVPGMCCLRGHPSQVSTVHLQEPERGSLLKFCTPVPHSLHPKPHPSTWTMTLWPFPAPPLKDRISPSSTEKQELLCLFMADTG